MKKLSLLLLLFPLLSFGQKKYFNVPVDSVRSLVPIVEQYFNTSLSESWDGYKKNPESYKFGYTVEYKDTTGNVTVKFKTTTKKYLSGNSILRTDPAVNMIVISGPTPTLQRLFREYFRKGETKGGEYFTENPNYYIRADYKGLLGSLTMIEKNM